MTGDSNPPDSDLEILREAEGRRGGCGAFLVAAIAFGLTFFGMMYFSVDSLLMKVRGNAAAWLLSAAWVCRFVVAIAVAILAAKVFTRVRLRLAGTRGSRDGPRVEP